ncbi:lipid-binding SYLF domain-containing protein [Sulfurospirillum sp. 1612]|uniref:lipid-binding SYLF domain-containing protein n=1 Tax=Sulfurospirillum sp. 1612 TaxID=3094835 RepID=UPI002F92A75C
MKKYLLVLIFSALCATLAVAGPREQLLDSANIIKEMARSSDMIPSTVLTKARAVVVFPDAKKIGFFLGGEFGHGVAVIKKSDGSWGNPFFVTLESGSLGWQFGFEMNSILLIFNTQSSANSLLENSMTMGADASISAGPLSQSFEKNSKIDLSAEIFSYRKAKGLFIGLSLKGAVIRHDSSQDVEYYGNGMKASDIVMMPIKEDSFAIREFRAALNLL